MALNPDTSTDLSTGVLYRHIGDLLVSDEECSLDDAFQVIGHQTGLSLVLWLRHGGDIERLACYPRDATAAEAYLDRVLELADGLSEPLIRSVDATDSLLTESRWQAVWPLSLESGYEAIWLVESGDESLPDVSSLAQLIRVALLLRLGRERQAEHEVQLKDLRSAQELMGHIVDALPVGLYVVDDDYRIVAWNRKREAGTQGVAREDAIGKSVFEVLYRQPKDQISDELKEVFETDEIRRYEVDSKASGERRFYRLTKVPMHVTNTDDVTHVITVGEDITEQKRIAERISHAEKLAALGQMAAGVMHEINNPLATITACVEAVQEAMEEGSDGEEMLSMIETEVDRCKRIARDLLAFSRPPPSEKGPEAACAARVCLRHASGVGKLRASDPGLRGTGAELSGRHGR
jgi:PAS domain S-box-containing protein